MRYDQHRKWPILFVGLAGWACSSRMEHSVFKEHVQDLASIAAETRLLLALERDDKVPRTFFRSHSEALADRTAEHLAELGRRETDDALRPQQARAISQTRALSDVLRPLANRIAPEANTQIEELETTFREMERAL
jgi:hypothetical protein